MVNVLLVGVGGFLGSVARYLVGGLVQERLPGAFPWGTLAVNALGCLLIGCLSELAEARSFLSPGSRALLVVGILGGFTTFSAFGNETLNLMRDRSWEFAAANVGAHVGLAIGAVWFGRALAYWIWR
jgi:CrcB protein